MWKPEHRAAADRRGLRYESDLTDGEWALVGSLIPPAKGNGAFPSEGASEGPAAAQHGLGVLGPVGLGRHVGTHSPRALCGRPGQGGQRSEPDDSDH